MRRLIFLLFISCLAYGPAHSQTAHDDGSTRAKLAETTLKALRPIFAALPTLSPAEQEWTESEFKAATEPGAPSSRLNNLSRSREWEVRMSRRWVNPAYEALTLIAEKKTGSKRNEMVLWAKVSDALRGGDLWASLDGLAKKGVIDTSLVSPQGDRLLLEMVVPSLSLSNYVIPYLENTLPD